MTLLQMLLNKGEIMKEQITAYSASVERFLAHDGTRILGQIFTYFQAMFSTQMFDQVKFGAHFTVTNFALKNTCVKLEIHHERFQLRVTGLEHDGGTH